MPYEAKTNWKYDDTVTEKDLNRIEQGLKDAHVAEYKDITLKPGVQIVDVPEDTPFRMGEIRGRTLINLLGRNGSMESIQNWESTNCDLKSDEAYKTQGQKSLKVISKVDEGQPVIAGIGNLKLKKGSYYIFVVDIKNGSANMARAELAVPYKDGTTDWNSTAHITESNKFTSQYRAFKVTKDLRDDATQPYLALILGTKEAGDYGYFDAARVYEISEKEYNRINSLDTEGVSAYFPYVDGVTNVTNPYSIATSGNLLPPFTEWTNTGNKQIIGLYELEINSKISDDVNYYFSVGAGCTMTLCVEHNGVIGVNAWDANNNLIGDQSIVRYTKEQQATFTTPIGTTRISVHFGNVDGNTSIPSCKFKNPMLVSGDKRQPFTPQSRSMLATECHLSAHPVDGSNADLLYVDDDGLPYVHSWWEKISLTDTFTWSVNAAVPGLKQLGTQLKIPYNPDTWSPTCVKFDGSILSRSGENPDVLTGSQDGKSVYIQISSKDSGWGDKYTPTDGEIKAYFLGWRMCQQETAGLYNGTGTRCWGRITDPANVIGQAGWNATTTLPTGYAGTDVKGNVYKPYRLQYLKVKPTVEPVVNYETGLTLLKGWNMVEVDSGIVLREKANFVINSASTHYCANTAQGGGDTPTPFRYRTEDILKVFKNRVNYIQWEKNIYAPNGKYRATIAKQHYDPTAVYHVTYTILGPTLAASISGSIASNLRGTVTDVMQWASDAERRLSVVENGAQDNISPESIGAAKKLDFDVLTKHSVAIKNSANKDLNTYREPGLYFIGNLADYTNSPSNDAGFSWGILRVETLGTTAYVAQSYTCVTSNTTFTRSKAEDVSGREWLPWRATTKLDTDGVLRLNKWLDIRADGPSINLYSSTHVYQQFIVKEKRVGYIGVGDPGAPQNMLLASDYGDVRLWAGNGGVFINDRNVLYEIDQLKQSGVNNKQALVDALNAKGIAASVNEDWGTLIGKVQQTSYMRSVNLDRESEIGELKSTFEHIYTIPAGVKRIIFTSSSNWATQMYTSYDSPVLEIALKDANGAYRTVASNYYNNYRYRSLDVYSFVVDFTLNISRSSYRVSSSDNVYNADGIGISNAGEIQLGFYYFTNGYYNGKGKINGTLQYE
ncbi:hypothetical protein BBG47_23045 [Paenibacillus sp. KS1]|uniref:pyocin knob domain-containing protein n=1 Tax=Paenibacillus sp. KS1 TaxID=1849249 RepID=UPI00080664F4|nr:pyocin knob domain-containing protein [Paenibacillus sp. KS1]OBY77211.1 hypothetical protein BBG47_23045 [Paenibacillus sp. KS1]